MPRDLLAISMRGYEPPADAYERCRHQRHLWDERQVFDEARYSNFDSR